MIYRLLLLTLPLLIYVMSCSSPKFIVNRASLFDSRYSKTGFQVGCGECLSCRSKEQDQWFTRAFSHLNWYKQNHGMVYFVTLTYNDAHLPHFTDDSACFTSPCFSYDDIKSFIQALRDKYRKRGVCPPKNYYPDFSQAPQAVDYLITSEFGSEKGRPHYHALIFVPQRFDQNGKPASENFCIAEARAFLRQSWNVIDPRNNVYKKRGFVRESKDKKSGRKLGISVDQANAAVYVTKYICKDIEFEDQSGFTDYLYSEPEFTSDRKKLSAHFRPRHYQSQHFGESLVNYLLDETDSFKSTYEGFKLFNPYMKNITGYQIFNHVIPSYIKDKLLFGRTCGRNGDRTYTEFGKKYLHYKMLRDVNKVSVTLKHNSLYLGLIRFINDSDLNSFRELGLVPDSVISVLDLSNFLNSFKIDHRNLALYALFLRYRISNNDWKKYDNRDYVIDFSTLYDDCSKLLNKIIEYNSLSVHVELYQAKKDIKYIYDFVRRIDNYSVNSKRIDNILSRYNLIPFDRKNIQSVIECLKNYAEDRLDYVIHKQYSFFDFYHSGDSFSPISSLEAFMPMERYLSILDRCYLIHNSRIIAARKIKQSSISSIQSKFIKDVS